MNPTSPAASASLSGILNFISPLAKASLCIKLGAIGLSAMSLPAAAIAADHVSPDVVTAHAYTKELRSPEEIRNRKRDPLNERIDRFQPGKFPVGFYIYKYDGIDEKISRMAELGFTSIHLIQTGNRDVWEATFDQCRELGISVLAQLDGVYLRLESDVEALVPQAVSIIQRYKDRPEIIAFSIKEEPNAAYLPKISEYYQGIYAAIPDAPIYLLHNYLRVMEAGLPPYPAMLGTDRYGFWWEYGTTGNRATPASAMRWYHTQMNGYYQNSLRQNGEFFAVFSPIASYSKVTKDQVRKSFYPKEIPEDERTRLAEMVDRFAEEGNQGWWADETEKDTYWHWKYYAAPKNTIRATAWLSVMEGAKSVYCYHWLSNREEVYGSRSSGELQMNEGQIQEYSVFAREIQRYGSLVRAMMKEFVPYAGSPLGHEEIETAALPEAVIDFSQDEVAFRTFRIDGYEGRVVVAVNQHVGEWSEGSPYRLKPDHRFRINKRGELIDYTPATGSRELNFAVKKSKMACLDLKTGKPVKLEEGGKGVISAEPGEGRMLFFYSEGSEEGERLLKEFAIR